MHIYNHGTKAPKYRLIKPVSLNYASLSYLQLILKATYDSVQLLQDFKGATPDLTSHSCW